MATVEKLLVQIFERRKWIVNQAKHQTYLLEHHLASKCLIDGIAPPPWLFSSSSDPGTVLNNHELISGVSLPRTQRVIPFTGSHCPVFDKPVPSAGNEELPNGLCTELDGFNKGFGAGGEVSVFPHCPISNPGCATNGVPHDRREEDASVTSPEYQRDARISDIYCEKALSSARGAGDKVSILPEYPINDAGCSSNGVPQDQREEDPSVTSPEDQRDARISDSFRDPDLSPARGAEVSILPQCSISNAECFSHGVPQGRREDNPGVTSPEGQRDTRTSDIYHDPALSLARVQRSKSRQKALEIRNSDRKSCSQGKSNVNRYAGGTVGCLIFSRQSDHVDELNVVTPVDTSDNSCEVEEAKMSEFPSKERGTSISSGRITRSRSSGQQKSSLNVSGSACIARESCGTPAVFIGISPQQSNHVSQPAELVNYSHITDSCQEPEAKVGDHFSKLKGSSIYSGRTTRSRSASQQANSLDELLKLEHISSSVSEDGFSNSIQQPKHVEEMVEVVKSFDIIDGSCEVKTKVGECCSTGHGTSGYCGRITRSRSSSQPLSSTGGDPDFDSANEPQVSILESLPVQNNPEFCAVNGENNSSKRNSLEYVSRRTGSAVRSFEKIEKDASCNISRQIINLSTSAASNKSNDAQRNQISVGRSVPIQKDLDLCAVNSTDSSDEENDADQYAGRNTSAETSCDAEGISKLVNSQALVHRGTQSRSAASNKNLAEKLTHGFGGIKHQDESSTMVKGVPCAQTSELVEVAIAGESQGDRDGSFEANTIRSGSKLDGTGLRVGVEVLVSRQPADCNVFVNPKQLNFDDMKESYLNGILTSALKKGMQGRSSEDRSVSLMHAEDTLEQGMIINYQEKCNSPLEKKILGHPEVSVKGKELHSGLSESPAEELSKYRSGLNGNVVSSVKETIDAHKDAVANTMFKSGKVQKSSLIDYPPGLQKSREGSADSLVKEVMGSTISNVNSAKPNELVSQASALDSHAIGNPIVSTDFDFAMVSVENNFAASMDKTKGHLAQPIIQSHISPRYELCNISDNGDVGYSKSTECQIAEKSKGRNFTSSMESSWPQHKRRKIEHKIVYGLYSSSGLREKVSHTANRDSICGNLGSLKHSPKAVLESQGLSISREDVVKSIVTKSPVEETHQNEDHCMIETSESSLKARMKEGEISFGEADISANAPFTFMHEELEASLLSNVMEQAAGHSRDCLMEETGVEHQTSIIVDAGTPCIEGNHVSLPLEDNLTLGSVEHLTCSRRTMREKIFALGGTSKFSYFSVGTPHGQSLNLIGADASKPELEGFVLETDDEPTSVAGKEISFDEWNLPSTTIERASILEQLCKSACSQTPVACSSDSYKLHKIPNLYQSVPTGLLEGTTFPMNDAVKLLKDGHSCLSEEGGQEFSGRSYSDCLSNCSRQSGWDIKKPYLSPVGKLWGRTGSTTSSSGKRGSLNQELPCISEENENTDEIADTFQDGIVSEIVNSSIQRVPLADISEIPNPPASVSNAEPYADRLSLDSVNTEFSLTGTHKSFKQKRGIQKSSKRRYNNKENLSISQGTNDFKRLTGSLHNRFSKPKLSGNTSLRGPSLSEWEPKRNNIVSGMTSFIPLVQQKQAAAVITGKRDIKVKALEAAETAKRLAEKKENERKMKKEALKLERSRVEQENMRQLELQKKKKEEERKKKEQHMAATKRQRKEEDRKERERKRMRVEARRQQREHEDKLPAEKGKKEMKCQANEGRGHGSTESKDETEHKKMKEERGYDTFRNISETEPSTSRVSTSNARIDSIVHEECCEALSNCGYNTEVLSNLDKAIENVNSVSNTSQEQSYEISPYKESDDENEDDDVILNSKFMPSWSSKNCLALAVSCQCGADPEAIFPPGSFCSISEVLLPRKHQLNYNGIR